MKCLLILILSLSCLFQTAIVSATTLSPMALPGMAYTFVAKDSPLLYKVLISGNNGIYIDITVDGFGYDYGLGVFGNSNAFDNYDITGAKVLIEGDSNTFDRGIID